MSGKLYRSAWASRFKVDLFSQMCYCVKLKPSSIKMKKFKILTLFILIFLNLIPKYSMASGQNLEIEYKQKLHKSLYEKFEVSMYNRLRQDGFDHPRALGKIDEIAAIGVKCQFEAFNKLPKTLVNQILTLVGEGKSIMESNHIAMTNFKMGYLSAGKSADDFLKFIEPSAIAWNSCMKENVKW